MLVDMLYLHLIDLLIHLWISSSNMGNHWQIEAGYFKMSTLKLVFYIFSNRFLIIIRLHVSLLIGYFLFSFTSNKVLNIEKLVIH